jgi:hypothetical protein
VRERLIDHAGGAQAAADPDKFRALAQMVMSLPEYQLN